LLQEAFARVLDRDVIDDISDPSAYLRQTASNLATDFTRRRKMEMKYVISDDAPHDPRSNEPSPEESVETTERAQALALAIDLLPLDARVFAMRMHQDVPQDEIARRSHTRKMWIGICKSRFSVRSALNNFSLGNAFSADDVYIDESFFAAANDGGREQSASRRLEK